MDSDGDSSVQNDQSLEVLHDEVFSDDSLKVLQQTGLPVVERGWLSVPEEMMLPKKMCAVNQFVHMVPGLDDPYISTSCELVLFGTGTAIPEHFRWMIYCMEMVRPVNLV